MFSCSQSAKQSFTGCLPEVIVTGETAPEVFREVGLLALLSFRISHGAKIKALTFAEVIGPLRNPACDRTESGASVPQYTLDLMKT